MPRKSKAPRSATPKPMTGPQRLNKLLAAAGLGSRRQVEQYIVDGRIEVDGQPVTDLATKVDAETAKVSFDGSVIKIFRPVYFALNKPVGVLSTNHDPSGRMRAIDLVNVKERIFSAGRLDRSSEGLMLLTNDGELVQRLSHPRFGVQKLYLATVQGEITQVDLEKLVRGVRLAEGYAKVDAVKLRRQRSGAAELEIVLSEGKNREIRRILARLGHKVVALKRLAIGPLRLGLLPPGGWRPLTRSEVEALYAAAATGRRKRRGTSRPASASAPDLGRPDGVMMAGQFDELFDSDATGEDDFMPSLDELPDEEFDDDDIVPIMDGDHSLVGTVLGYDEDGSDDEQDSDDVAAESRRPSRPARKAAGKSRGPRAGAPRSAALGGRSASPHDLRNRAGQRAKGSGTRGYTSSRSAGPRSTDEAARGPRTGKPGGKPGSRLGSKKRPASAGGREARPSGPGSKPKGKFGGQGGTARATKRADGRAMAPKSSGAKRGTKRGPGPRGGSGPRGSGPRGSGPRGSGRGGAGPKGSGPRGGRR